MARTNITLQLEAETVLRAKVLAARRGTSVSALVARTLDLMVEEDERYEAARVRALELLERPHAMGGRTWTRDDLYAERLDRYGAPRGE
ncbi:MAG: DUF6364 family protein [Candidatus Limnocylindrales bacterium]